MEMDEDLYQLDPGNWWVKAVKAGANSFNDRGGLWAVTEEIIRASAAEIGFSDIAEVYSVDPVLINFDFVPETDVAEGIILIYRTIRRLIQDYVSIRRKAIVCKVFRVKLLTVSPEVFESEWLFQKVSYWFRLVIVH